MNAEITVETHESASSGLNWASLLTISVLIGLLAAIAIPVYVH
jgi:Tfp pilus assembly major pilin PilA